jgi:tRNA U34 2-thiouridine synthase MnmA/TrmU
VTLDRVDKGLAPGQFAAFYDGDVCLGAGAIS